MVEQTHRLDAIIVIDDGSGEPPFEIVRQFPEVTLLASTENVGPYRIDQQVINATDYDAYLFQDADDWSSRDRLEILLAEAEDTSAELIGCQEVRIICDRVKVQTFNYPLDVNTALQTRPSLYGLLHPSSIVSRELNQRLGGLATGLRFGADREFLQRAVHAGLVRNIPSYCYFRRHREGSLTTDPSTGMRSQQRVRLQEVLNTRSAERTKAIAQGQIVSLAPYVTAGPIELKHITGPQLRPELREGSNRSEISPYVSSSSDSRASR